MKHASLVILALTSIPLNAAEIRDVTGKIITKDPGSAYTQPRGHGGESIDSPLLREKMKIGQEGKSISAKAHNLSKMNLPIEKTIDMEVGANLEKIGAILKQESDQEYKIISSGAPGEIFLYRGWVIVDGPDNERLFTRFHNIYKASAYANTLPLVHRVMFENMGDQAQAIADKLTKDPSYTINSEKFISVMGISPALVVAGKDVSGTLYTTPFHAVFFRNSISVLHGALEFKEIFLCSGPVFAQYKNLKSLSLSHNKLLSIDISHNTALERLDLSDNKLAFVDVTYNTALKELDLSQNQLIDIKGLSNLKNLKILSLDDNPSLNLNKVRQDTASLTRLNKTF